jgi:hypothetical protein
MYVCVCACAHMHTRGCVCACMRSIQVNIKTSGSLSDWPQGREMWGSRYEYRCSLMCATYLTHRTWLIFEVFFQPSVCSYLIGSNIFILCVFSYTWICISITMKTWILNTTKLYFCGVFTFLHRWWGDKKIHHIHVFDKLGIYKLFGHILKGRRCGYVRFEFVRCNSRVWQWMFIQIVMKTHFSRHGSHHQTMPWATSVPLTSFVSRILHNIQLPPTPTFLKLTLCPWSSIITACMHHYFLFPFYIIPKFFQPMWFSQSERSCLINDELHQISGICILHHMVHGSYIVHPVNMCGHHYKCLWE